MRPKFLWLVAATLLQGSLVRAQVTPLARKVFSSDTISAVRATISPDQRWLIFATYINELESRLMIRPLAGGEPRLLVPANPRVWYGHPQLTPQGDRLVLVSNLPRRNATDPYNYLVAAPFDTRTGTLSGPLRQVTLEGVRGGPVRFAPAISPDGRYVAYNKGGSNAVQVVPITGGNARQLVETTGNPPGFLAWTPDGRALLYSVPEPQEFVRMRVSADGGAPSVVARFSTQRGSLSPDNRHSFVIDRGPNGAQTAKLTVFAGDGRPLGSVEVPKLNPFLASFSADGKYILAPSDNAIATIKVVPVAGGPVRQITPGATYDFPGGWTPDGKAIEVETVDQGRPVYALYSLSGELLSKVAYPEDAPGINPYGISQGQLVYRAGDPSKLTGWRLMAMNLADRTRKELARDVTTRGGSPAGGMYYGIGGGEFYYRQLVGGRVQLRAMTVRGESRLVGEFPLSLSATPFHIYKDRVVYRETVKDSVRLQLSLGPGKAPKTIGTFPKAEGIGEYTWSYDGRRLAVSVGNLPQKLLLYRFDASGAVEGAPQSFTLPFEYWYETFWLPDGSGLTMIAQQAGKGNTDIVLVKLADPLHPIVLTAEDPHGKWGHSLSPDGRYVAYPSEQIKGTSIYLIEVAELLKRIKP